jgi:DNA-binding NarL/FixJ family response regulator
MATLSDLTPREIEILQSIPVGRANKGIAVQVCFSEKWLSFTFTTSTQRLVYERP